MNRMVRATLVACASAALVSVGAGCLIGGSSNTTRSGNYVSPATFSQIERGKTSAGWVEATLGPPSTRTPIEPDGEIWKYTYTETKDSSGYVFLIFGGSGSDTKTSNAYVQIERGVVVKTWRD